jgi:two-component system, sensor histidine kinase and response regulator
MMSKQSAPSSHDEHELFSAAINAVSEGICFIDERGTILLANPALCGMLGYTRTELVGQGWMSLVPPHRTAKTARFFVELFAESHKVHEEWQALRKDGSLLSVFATFKPVTTQSGARRVVITLAAGNQSSITGQFAKHGSEDLYRHVVENVSEGIVVIQGNRLIFSNRGACQLSGYTQEEMHELPLTEMLYPDDVPKVVERLRRRMQGEAVERHMAFRVLHKSGQPIWVDSNAIAIDWEGQPAILSFLIDSTERRQQEAALIKSEEHYRQVVSNVSEGILVVQSGVIAFTNPRMLHMMGYAEGEQTGLPFPAFIHPDDVALVADHYTRRLAGEDVEQHYIVRIVNHQTRQIIWAELSAVVIDWEGQPATLSFVTDVSHRKQLEDSLKQSLAERDTILENSLVGMVFLDAAGRVQWANGAMFQIFGVERADVHNQSLEKYYPSRQAYLETGGAVAAAVQSGKAYEAEIPMQRGDGTAFWVYISGRAVNQKDLSQGTVWVVMDITKRRRLETDSKHYELLVKNVTECIAVVQDGKLVYANPRVEQLSGLSQEQLLTTPFITSIHAEDRPMVIDNHVRRLRGEEVQQHYQFRLVNQQTGQSSWVELSAVMIDWEGKPATLSFMTDITERRQLEESLRVSFAERTRLEKLQIQNELKEAEMARHHAEETTAAKSMFLANMSHEIRTPMNAIIGMAHLALLTELNAKQRDYVEKIYGAGTSLLGIINDILDFSKIEAGKLEIEKVEFRLDDVLNNVSTVTNAKAHEKGLEYLFQISPSIPRNLIGDPLRLGQILTNLINNAVKFTKAGEVVLTCRQLDATSGHQIQLEFIVRDTGIGMSEEQSEKLFTAFSQADESTTRKYGGTGLGLSIAKGMVERMGGAISLKSALDRGTTVRFTAWFGVAQEQPTRSVIPQAINGLRILIVDDNSAACMVMAENLSTLPVQVKQITDARAALAAICDSDLTAAYDVVFTDLVMPEIDGIDLIHAIKNDAALKNPPQMILVSGFGKEELLHRAESALADGFLMKPVSPSMLIDALIGLYAPKPGTPHSHIRNAKTQFAGLTALLVEDNEINQQIARELMESAGIKVEIADNGRIAVDMLKAAGPDRYGLVFMDVQMPVMDGHAATREIRSAAEFQSLPIIAMTAHAMVEERERCLASGMNGHIAKPVNPDELYHIISAWCPANVDRVLAEEMNSGQAQGDNETQDDLQIDGIDVQDGLMRTLGNRTFYLQMLARFHDGQRDAVAQIRQALDEPDDRQAAERIAHTLKGVAGQLGVTAVNQLAAQIESRIRRGEGKKILTPLLDGLDAELKKVISALDPVLAKLVPQDENGAAPQTGISRKEAYELMQEIAKLMRQYDADAIELLNESNTLLAQILGSMAHQKIIRAVRQYDFDSGLSVLIESANAVGYGIV